jgi:hypothetical protein
MTSFAAARVFGGVAKMKLAKTAANKTDFGLMMKF